LEPESVFQQLSEAFATPALSTVYAGQEPRASITSRLEAAFYDMLEIIAPKLTLEIGANEASFSREVRRRLPGAETIAFEANPYVYREFSAALGDQGVDYRLLAVSDISGEVELKIPTRVGGAEKPLTNGMASLMTLGAANSDHISLRIDSVTLDDVAGEDDRNSVWWIDVEGAADQVLRGGRKALGRAQALYLELEDQLFWKEQVTAQAVFDELVGFRPFIRDCQRGFQYNVVLLRPDLLAQPGIQAIASAYVADALTLLDTR
jgi:FkbM family methyltransferase